MSDITIRVATPDDAAALLDLYAPYVRETAISFETVVPSEDEFRRRIIHTLQRYPYLVAEYRGVIFGYVDMRSRHHGVGRALYEAIERVSRAQHIQSLCACIGVPDGADDDYLTRNSIDFHAHMGYRMVGEFQRCGYKFGRWYNMAWMEKHIGDHPQHPEPVIAFPQLRDSL